MGLTSSQFSERENDVICLLLQGKSNKAIALELGISQRTVEFHLSNIYHKSGVASRAEAIIKLSQTHLRETTGSDFQVKSTVEAKGGSTENGFKTILRRITMKKLFPIIGGGLLLAALTLAFFYSRPTHKTAPLPRITSGAGPTLASPTMQRTTATATHEPKPTATQTQQPTPSSEAALPLERAHFVSENYPDGSRVEKGSNITKTWQLQNSGESTWTNDYSLKIINTSYPLGKSLNEPYQIKLPQAVKPGEMVTISASFTIPDSDGTYEVDYTLQNNKGQQVTGDGNRVWLKIVAGNETAGGKLAQANQISMTLINIQKNETTTDAEVCAQPPDTQDWNLSGVFLTAAGVQYSFSGYMLKNPKNASTYTHPYRCYLVNFPVGSGNFGAAPVSITIASIRVPAENKLEENCTRAKAELSPLYPGLDFSCGPAGFYYSHLKLPSGMSTSKADALIMDALEQAISGPWVLSE
jgi:DNA-binding CsgD family transcriptional regulator